MTLNYGGVPHVIFAECIIHKQTELTISLEIIIKSARRPWALDRLLNSLNLYLAFQVPPVITVVDDRTDDHYIDLLRDKYPHVNFDQRSEWEGYVRKRDTLPYVKAWQRAAESSKAKYVLILEDDQWLSRRLDLDLQLQFLEARKSYSHNLSQSADDLVDVIHFDTGDPSKIAYLPQLLIAPEGQRQLAKAGLRVLTSPTLIQRKIAGIFTVLFPSKVRPIWKSMASINPMCGAIFLRTHWLDMWGGKVTWINENIQISRVMRTLSKVKDPSQALSFESEKHFFTTYVSTVSLTLGTGVNWEKVNAALSESWSKGEMEYPDFDKDWDKHYLAGLIESSLGQEMKKEYLSWCARFAALHQI